MDLTYANNSHRLNLFYFSLLNRKDDKHEKNVVCNERNFTHSFVIWL